MCKKTHQWIPDGRGVVINYQRNLIYMGQIKQQKLSGLGMMIPFEKQYNSPKGHLMETNTVAANVSDKKKFKIC